MSRIGGTRGGGRTSKRMGDGDPRAGYRNHQTNNDVRINYGPEFELDRRQRLVLKLGPELLRAENGEIQLSSSSSASESVASSSSAAATTTSRNMRVKTRTASYVVGSSYDVILVDATSGAVTITLPSPSGQEGRRVYVKRTDGVLANAVTVDCQLGNTIDGATSWPLASQYESLTMVCDGADWWIL